MGPLCSSRGAAASLVLLVLLAVCHTDAKLEPGASCSNTKDHCDTPKSGMGCCLGNTKCYETKDCASFIKTCPFTSDTKKGLSLAPCLPDKSEFVKTACPAAAKAAAKAADGKDIPLNATVTCFKSDKLTCQVFKNGTGHSTVVAACKEAAKKASTAAAPTTLHACLLLGLLLVAGFVAVMGSPL